MLRTKDKTSWKLVFQVARTSYERKKGEGRRVFLLTKRRVASVGIALARRYFLDLMTSKDSRLSWPKEAWFQLNPLVSYE